MEIEYGNHPFQIQAPGQRLGGLESSFLSAIGFLMKNCVGAVLALFFLLGFSQPSAAASCDIAILEATPCRYTVEEGFTEGTPRWGEKYTLKVRFRVTGTPQKPYSLIWKMADRVWPWENLMYPEGTHTLYAFMAHENDLELDGPFQWSISVDPDGKSGDKNFANNTANGSFSPVLPNQAVTRYNPILIRGTRKFSMRFDSVKGEGKGAINDLTIFLGSPSSHGQQEIIDLLTK